MARGAAKVGVASQRVAHGCTRRIQRPLEVFTGALCVQKIYARVSGSVGLSMGAWAVVWGSPLVASSKACPWVAARELMSSSRWPYGIC